MNKASIDKREIRSFINDSRINNKTDQDIYNELKERYSDKKAIALLITGTAKPELKEKYKSLNMILLVLIAISVIIKVLFVLGMTVEVGKAWPLFLILIIPLINVYFFYEVLRFNATIYRFIGILTIVSIIRSLRNFSDANGLDILVSFILAGGIIGLSFYLGSVLIPNYNPKNLEMDTNGEYLFK